MKREAKGLYKLIQKIRGGDLPLDAHKRRFLVAPKVSEMNNSEYLECLENAELGWPHAAVGLFSLLDDLDTMEDIGTSVVNKFEHLAQADWMVNTSRSRFEPLPFVVSKTRTLVTHVVRPKPTLVVQKKSVKPDKKAQRKAAAKKKKARRE